MGTCIGLADVLLAVALRTVTWLGIATAFNRLITQLYREFFPEIHQ